MRVQLKKYELDCFDTVCEELEVVPDYKGTAYCRFDKRTTVWEYLFSPKIKRDYRELTKYITGKDDSVRHIFARVLYNIYATNNLILLHHQYPSYELWQHYHPGFTLDHILPKFYYPHMVFEVTNWQPLSKVQNREKGVVHFKELHTMLEQEIAQIDSYLSML